MAITIPILTDFDGRGIDRGIKQFDQLEGKGQKAGFLIKKAALPAAAALAGLGAAAFVSAKAAAEDAAAQDKLAGTLQRVTGASAAVVASTEDYISTLSQAVGVADDELRPALGKLATVTRDVGKAQELLSIALDVSAQTGKPLEAVTTGLAKAYGGNLGALKKLIPGFDEGIIKSKDFEKAQAELAKLTGGAASESANTAAGQFRRFGIAIEETKESIGAALLPIIQAFLPILQRMAAFVQENSGVVVALGAAVGALSVVVLAVNAAMKVAAATTAILTAAQIAYNIALNANPIGIVVLALAALVTGVIAAYKASGTFREIIDGLFSAFSKAFGYVRDTVGPIIEAFIKAVKSTMNWIEENAGPALRVLETGFKTAFAPIYLAITAMEKLLKLLGSWDKGPRGVPNLTRPGAGSGGMTGRQNEMGLTGVRGLAPLPVSLMVNPAANAAMAPRANNITINMQAGLVSTPDQVGQQIIEAIQRAQRRSGPAFAPA